ncbi:hypothetical protein GCM10009801_27940 [Streptomyces albiaxialis]|uniref:Uncharacterized protein n=1 Tax=Streptomyces albiaxialis TaxID=329523 RepID=A0ABP5HEP1_9ACTN
MSFGTYARQVRDEGLPPHRRHGALRHAVERYGPLGFHATWAYVITEALPSPDLRRDPAALVRALAVLEESRAVWLRDVAAYAAVRRAEKARGLRVPRGAEAVPLAPGGRGRPRWPGDSPPSRLGLVAAVADQHAALRRASPEPPDPSLHRTLDACAAGFLAALGRPDESTRGQLASIIRELEARPAVTTLPWVRLARLLDYATHAAR